MKINFSPKITKFNKISIFFIIFIFIDLIKYSKENITITKIENFTSNILTWNINESYIYYIDIQEYKVGEENVLQILHENKTILTNTIILEIDESFLNDNNIDNIKVLDNITHKNIIKYRDRKSQNYLEIVFNKIENKNNYVLYIIPNVPKNVTQVFFHLSTPIPQFNIYKDHIDNGNVFNETFYIDNKIEKFFKFNLKNISLQNANVIFFVNDNYISDFYRNTISTNLIKGRIYILEKNSTIQLNHTIYLALLGEIGKTTIQIFLDYHDIKYSYVKLNDGNSFYFEQLNCKKDFYIINHYDNNNNYKKPFNLQIIPLYGDYKLTYYDNIQNVTELFEPNNEMNVTEKIKNLTNNYYYSILKLSCKTPTLLKLKYVQIDFINNINMTDGKEITTFMNYNYFKNNYIVANDPSRIYKFYFGIIGESEFYNETQITLFLGGHSDYLTTIPIKISKGQTYYRKKDIYYEKNVKDNKLEFQVYVGAYIKAYLISNQYYENIVSGLTKINSETKAISFKVRKDVIFDYFVMKSYSHNHKKFNCEYELKIVEPEYIENGKVMLGIDGIQEFKKEIIVKFNNPYGKFNSRIKEEDYVYLLVSFNIKKEDFYPIYIDIRYYSNNKIINIEQSEPKILLIQKEYKIFGDKNINEKNKILLNINKCNSTKDYFIKNYYENNDNIIIEEKISKNRNIIFYDNIFNNTNLLLYSNDVTDIKTDNNNLKNPILQATYYENGDLYMNYFSINESLYDLIKITNDYKISYKDNRKTITFSWNDYISNKDIINNLQVNYSLFILPVNSPINTVCQMSLIPPNITIINNNRFEYELSKGKYKVSIIASVKNNEFPIITFYDWLNIDVPKRINFLIIIYISIGVVVLIIGIVLIIFCKKKIKKDDINNIRLSRDSRMISMAKFLGYDEQEEKVLINNEENDDNIMNNYSKNDSNSLNNNDYQE